MDVYPMLDLIALAAGIISFAVLIAYVHLCDKI